MAISLCASRDIRKLSKKLSDDLARLVPHIDPFQPICIVTQTVGMNIWLKSRLAEEMSISANVHFLTPTELMAKIHAMLGGNREETLSGESMTWILYRLLGEQAFKDNPMFVEAVAYMGDDQGKRLGLAEQLTDLFDQYQVYRHDTIEQWNAGQVDDPSSFQAYLWRKLKEEQQPPILDKTEMRQFILDGLSQLDADTAAGTLGPLQNLYFFGLSVFTPYHMDIFEALSRVSDTRFYLLNPAASDYWYEDFPEQVVARWRHLRPDYPPRAGNDLLTSWGKVIRQTFRMFFERDAFLNVYESLDDEENRDCQDASPPAAGTMLTQVQRLVTGNVTGRDRAFSTEQLKDGSIQVHACYTPAREVEALYNYLVGLAEKDKTLTGRDIIVSCDIDLYAPYIRAVFDTGPVKFRYVISDATYLQEDNPLKALLAILELSESAFNAENVLGLLDFTCIRQKFGIENMELVHEMVKEALFRFGMEGNTADDSHLFSLAQAIKKIVYGISMRIDDKYDGFFPLDMVEGQDSGDALRFCLFAETLMELVRDRHDKTLGEWGSYIERVMSSMLFEEDPEDEKLLYLQEMLLRQLGNYYVVSGSIDEPVPFRIFARSFGKLLSRERRMKEFFSQGITFCSYVPMRSLPFRVVCMLGMDFDKFPRQDYFPRFSLIDGTKPGDRSIRDHDKHLFLENLMAAREHLYISYTGSSVKDNATIPPSILVDELVNYIAERSDDPDSMRKKFVVRHPLHAFSNRYNAGDDRLVNYLVDDRPQEIPMQEPQDGSDQREEKRVVSLDDLCAFYRNPVKYYYNKVLSIYYEDTDELLPVTEKFELNDLDNYNLKKEILDHGLQEEDLDDQIIKGDLPPGNMADAVVAIAKQKVNFLESVLKAVINNEACTKKEVNIKLENNLPFLKGNVSSLYGDKFICYTLSGSPQYRKYLFVCCLQYLALRACANEIKGVFIWEDRSKKKKEVKQCILKAIEENRAKSILETLLKIFMDYQHKVLSFYPDIDFPIDDELLVENVSPDELDLLTEKIATKIGDHFEGDVYDNYGWNAYKNGIFDSPQFQRDMIDNMRKIYGSLIPAVIDTNDLK